MADPLPPIPPAMRKTGWSPVKIVAIGCGAIVLAMGLFVAAIVTVVLYSMRSSDAYKAALATVQASPDAREVLGEPIAPGWWTMGSIRVSGPTGSASLSFPVSGPNGQAEVFVEAYKRTGEWRLVTLIVKPKGGARSLDLSPGAEEPH